MISSSLLVVMQHKLVLVSFLCADHHSGVVDAFSTRSIVFPKKTTGCGTSLFARRTITQERTFDPMGLATNEEEYSQMEKVFSRDTFTQRLPRTQRQDTLLAPSALATVASTAVATMATPDKAWAAATNTAIYTSGSMDPKAFVPVCPASDGVYRFLQSSTSAIVGDDNFIEYGPLIAGGLLRIRLELCVVESFFAEAVGPFIEKNGVSWILPAHETVETFLAGVIFSLASTFILIGSTKIISVLVLYVDFLLGVPCRLLGGFLFDRSMGKPLTFDIGFGRFKTRVMGPSDEELESISAPSNPVSLFFVAISSTTRFIGQILKVIRDIFDAIDQFVGKNLIVWATGYILIKFLHFKVFPDFPNL